MYALPSQSVTTLAHPARPDVRCGKPTPYPEGKNGVAQALSQPKPQRLKVADRWQSEYRFQYLAVQPKPPYPGFGQGSLQGASPLDAQGVQQAVTGHLPCHHRQAQPNAGNVNSHPPADSLNQPLQQNQVPAQQAPPQYVQAQTQEQDTYQQYDPSQNTYEPMDSTDIRYLALAGHICKEHTVSNVQAPNAQGFLQGECQKCGTTPVTEEELFVPFEPSNQMERNPKFFKFLPPTLMNYIPPAGRSIKKGDQASNCLNVFD